MCSIFPNKILTGSFCLFNLFNLQAPYVRLRFHEQVFTFSAEMPAAVKIWPQTAPTCVSFENVPVSAGKFLSVPGRDRTPGETLATVKTFGTPWCHTCLRSGLLPKVC